MSKIIQNFCLVCGLNKSLKYKIIQNKQVYSLWSQKCIEDLKNQNVCSWCKHEIKSNVKYLPNFGNGFNLLCSEACLKKI